MKKLVTVSIAVAALIVSAAASEGPESRVVSSEPAPDTSLSAGVFFDIFSEEDEDEWEFDDGVVGRPRPGGVKPASASVPLGPRALNSAYAVGVYVSHNMRYGYRKFDDNDNYLFVDKTNPYMFGVALGKRLPLGDGRLRVQALAEGGWGRVEDMAFPGGSLHSVYLTGGAAADAHFLFPSAARTSFISAGLGVHVTNLSADLKGEPDALGRDDLSKKTRFSPSISIGAGSEQWITPKKAVAIVYNFRILQSAAYIETGELYLRGAEHYEYFYSHALHLHLLLPEKGAKGKGR